jgi:hypothetical protein
MKIYIQYVYVLKIGHKLINQKLTITLEGKIKTCMYGGSVLLKRNEAKKVSCSQMQQVWAYQSNKS